jgi:hypothetical protein
MPDVKTVLSDPKFYELPEGERVKVIASLDQNFTLLAPEEQLKVVTRQINSQQQTPSVPPPSENTDNIFTHPFKAGLSAVGEQAASGGEGIIDSLSKYGTEQLPISLARTGAAALTVATSPLAPIWNLMTNAGRTLAAGAPQVPPFSLQSGTSIPPEAAKQQQQDITRMGNVSGHERPTTGSKEADIVSDIMTGLVPMPELLTAAVTKWAAALSKRVESGSMTLREAKQFISTLPEVRAANTLKHTEARGAIAGDIAQARSLREQLGISKVQEGNQTLRSMKEELVNPLEEQQKNVFNARTTASADLALQRKNIKQELDTALSNLNLSKTQALSTTTKNVDKSVQDFASSVGKQMTKTEIQNGSVAAIQEGKALYDKRVTALEDSIRDMFHSPANHESVPTGKFDDAGNEIWKPMDGPIDRIRTRVELKPMVERNRESLTISANQGDPGAKAALEIVYGPRFVPGDVALADITALNRAAYGKSDTVFLKPGESTARTVANAYRKAYRAGVNKMGGEEAMGILDEIQAQMKKRDEIFKTGVGVAGNPKIAQGAAKTIFNSGDAAAMVNDPVKYRTLIEQLDNSEARAGVRNQIARIITGKSHADFVKNWAKADPEVKLMTFGENGVARGDELAAGGTKALSSIAEKAIEDNNRLIVEANRKLNIISKEQADLSKLTIQARNMRTGIKQAQDLVKQKKEQLSTELSTAMQKSKDAIGEEQRARNFELSKSRNKQILDLKEQERMAKEKIQQWQNWKKIGFGTAGVLGLWKASNVARMLIGM